MNICVRTAFAISHVKEAEVTWFYEDLQDLQELTPKKDVLFIIGDWNTKGGGQEKQANSAMEYKMKQFKA